MPRVIGGRYGLSSKEFDPSMAKAVFDELAKSEPKNHFTVGIYDDVSHTSLDVDRSFFTEPDDVVRAVFYGLGADGTVSANKSSVKIIGHATDLFAQGHSYRTTKTGHCARCNTRCETLARNSPSHSDKPREPITMSPASSSFAISRMTCGTLPRGAVWISLRALTPASFNALTISSTKLASSYGFSTTYAPNGVICCSRTCSTTTSAPYFCPMSAATSAAFRLLGEPFTATKIRSNTALASFWLTAPRALRPA